nr:DUF3426 domain-containing protein [Luteimonas saliphila]
MAAGEASAAPAAVVEAATAASTIAAAAPVANAPPPGTASEAKSVADPAGGSPPATRPARGAGDADRAREPVTAPADIASPPAAPPAETAPAKDAGPDAADPLPPLPADIDPSPSGDAAPAPAPATAPDAPDAAGRDTPAIPTATEPGPGFLSSPAPAATSAGRARRLWRAAAIAALALLLGLQVLLADRARLAADARWRPFVAATCGVFGCSLPPWREPAAFVLVAREVRPHPDVPGALRVRATFRNDARWPQAWPTLLLTLSDVDGRPVAARAFGVDEYLGETAPTLVAPGQTADIALDIREPSVATVSFAFEFVR